MAWFGRSNSSENEALLLGALDDLLAFLESEHADAPARLSRLRERLARPPVPSGVRRELVTVLSQLQVSAGEPSVDVPGIVASMASALVDSMQTGALLDAELASQIQHLKQRVPARVGVGDARKLIREADAVYEKAVPARERAERSRRETRRLVADLSNTLGPTLRHSASLDWGISELSNQLASATEPDALAYVRADLVSITRDLAGASSSVRRQLGQALQQVRDLEKVLQDTEAQLAKARADSERDPLTGLLNRGSFDRRLVESVQARGGGRDQDDAPLCLVVIDIDHFKRVNDTYGHPAGDEVLRRVSDHLKKQVRSSDMVARVGGEEFGILLEGIDSDVAREVVERIRTVVQDDVHPVENGELRVTLSAGIAQLVLPETALDLYKRADAALYAAKSQGRNRFVLAA